MSKFLKAIVNIILLVAILSAGALLVPPLLGVTTKVSNGTGNTNLSRGSVTYATSARANELEAGDRILRETSDGSYVYTVSAIASDTSTYTLKDEVSQKTQEQQLTGGVQKVVLTLPAIGMLSLTLQSREGIIILGLCVAFLIILFILSEVWRRDEDEDEDDEDEDAEDEADEDEDRPLTRREKRRLKKEMRKKEDDDETDEGVRIEKEQELAVAKQTKESCGEKEGDDVEEVRTLEEEPEEEVVVNPAALETLARERQQAASGKADEDKELEQSLAKAVGEMMGEGRNSFSDSDPEEAHSASEKTDAIYIEETAAAPETEAHASEEEEASKEPEESPIELAIPVHTAEELLRKAEDNGDHPKVIEDRETGVTILDYSEIL